MHGRGSAKGDAVTLNRVFKMFQRDLRGNLVMHTSTSRTRHGSRCGAAVDYSYPYRARTRVLVLELTLRLRPGVTTVPRAPLQSHDLILNVRIAIFEYICLLKSGDFGNFRTLENFEWEEIKIFILEVTNLKYCVLNCTYVIEFLKYDLF